MIRTILAGPGRAGMAVALAMVRAGHTVAGVLARRPEAAADAAHRLGAEALGWGDPLPAADLLVVAVSDDAIEDAASRIAPIGGAVPAAVHLSGLAPVAALAPLAAAGMAVGSFHPLQTLPTAEAGADRLAGAWIAVTADDGPLAARLGELATSLEARPFDLDDEAKPLYHAGAAAAANFPMAALAMAEDLFRAAGVPFDAARPLVEAIVANAFDLGPGPSLTGPVARGDVGTVAAQRAAVREAAPDLDAAFVAFTAELARRTGRTAEFSGVLA